jgi:hypothetical protein
MAKDFARMKKLCSFAYSFRVSLVDGDLFDPGGRNNGCSEAQ